MVGFQNIELGWAAEARVWPPTPSGGGSAVGLEVVVGRGAVIQYAMAKVLFVPRDAPGSGSGSEPRMDAPPLAADTVPGCPVEFLEPLWAGIEGGMSRFGVAWQVEVVSTRHCRVGSSPAMFHRTGVCTVGLLSWPRAAYQSELRALFLT